MKKIVIGMHAGQAGTDAWEFVLFEDAATEEEMSQYAWELAKNHAEMYGIYPAEEYNEEDREDDFGGDSYSDNIEGWCEAYNPDKHDGHTMHGIPHWQKY